RDSLVRLANLETLLMNGSRRLLLIDAEAIRSMPRLSRVDLNDCPRLEFVSELAAIDCPALPRLSAGRRSERPALANLFPPEIRLAPGQRLLLPCRSLPPMEGRGRWLLPDTTAEATSSASVWDRVRITADQDLLIADASVQHTGLYRCVFALESNRQQRTLSGSRRDNATDAPVRAVRIIVKRSYARLELIQ
uniref:Ig-like domain-containing protein n=1 Tax=Macrostomum lignano TaxID=282301 RepID=A0A1I8HPD1_9PLAT